MKKNKIINILKTGILLFGISLLLWNCQKNQENEIINTKQASKFLFKKINFKEFENNQLLIQKINAIQNKTSKQLNRTQNKTKKNGFTVYLKQATYIENKNNTELHSYTFPVQSDHTSPILQNIVLTLTPNNTYKAYLATYNISLEQRLLLEKGTSLEISEKLEMKPLNINDVDILAKEVCHEVPVFKEVEVACSIDGCWEEEWTTWTTTVAWEKVCRDDGSAINNNNTDGNHTGGGGSSRNITNVTTTPTVDSVFFLISQITKRVALTSQEIDFLKEDTSGLIFHINDFLDEDDSIEADKFAKEVIKTKIENPSAEIDFEEQIINNFKDKADCVYGKLMESSTDFKNMIQKFDGEFPVSHLKLEMRDLGNTRAVTEAPDGNGGNNSPDYVITIALNSNSNEHGVNYRPNLMTAKTIAHEVIHAEMYRKLLSVLDNGGNIQGVTRQNVLDALDGNFPGLYDYYMRYNFDTATPNNGQHQAMATHYRETIASGLQVFDTGIPVPIDSNGNPIISQLYMDLAWEGLRYDGSTGNNAIYTWTRLSQPEKDRVDSVIRNYIEVNKNENCR